MGEDWRIIALPRREKLDIHGKYDDVLFDGSPAAFVMHLAVPQASKYRQIDLIQVPGQVLSCMRAFANRPYSKELYTPPVRGTTTSELKRECSSLDGTNTLRAVGGTSGLSSLPIELLDEVFQYLGIRDLFVLGIQSQSLWNVAHRHIRAMNVAPCGSWARQCIVGVANDSEPTDVPLILLTDSEVEQLQEQLSEDGCFDPDSDEPYREYPRQHSVAYVPHQNYKDREYRPSHHFRHLALKLGEWSRLPENFQSRICEDLDEYDMATLYPEDQPWVLRNLRTHEFVRSEAIALKPEYIHGPRIDYLGFGEVVWSFICWFTKENCAMDNTHKNYFDSWAGSCFEITTLAEHEKESLAATNYWETWRDASERIADRIDRIWSAKFGSNWRDIITAERQ
ncbi:MAG: hypothetical protein Q9191_004273 [Dirinaria sp. TL-2023a]